MRRWDIIILGMTCAKGVDTNLVVDDILVLDGEGRPMRQIPLPQMTRQNGGGFGLGAVAKERRAQLVSQAR